MPARFSLAAALLTAASAGAQNPAPPPTAPPAKVVPAIDPNLPPEWPKDVQGRNLAEWLLDTNSPDPAVRQNAVQLLPYFGPDARKPAIPAIIRLCTDPDPGVRIATFGAVGNFAFEGDADQRRVFEAMRVAVNTSASGSPTRQSAIRAWAAYGPDAGITVPVMDPLKTDSSWETRLALATALGRVGAPVYGDATDPSGKRSIKKPGHDGVFPTLRYLLVNDKCTAVRMEAVVSLLNIGVPQIANPVEYLKAVQPQTELVAARLGAEKDKTVIIWLHVLRVMYDERQFPQTLPKVAAYLRDQDLAVRAQALQAVGVMGPKGYTLLPDVRDCLKSYTEPIMLAAALMCIKGMGKEAAGVLEDVEQFRDKTTNEDLKKLAGETIDALKGVKRPPPPPPGLKPPEAAMPKP